jgi:hypothetical protein
VTASTPSPDSDFDRGTVSVVIARVHIEDCAKPGGPSVTGHARITIAPSGVITSASIDQGPLVGTAVGRCIEDRYRAARVPPFSGVSRIVGKSFTLP